MDGDVLRNGERDGEGERRSEHLEARIDRRGALATRARSDDDCAVAMLLSHSLALDIIYMLKVRPSAQRDTGTASRLPVPRGTVTLALNERP